MSVKLRDQELVELAKIRIRNKTETIVIDHAAQVGQAHTVVLECEEHPEWWLRVNGCELPSVVDKALGHVRDTHL